MAEEHRYEEAVPLRYSSFAALGSLAAVVVVVVLATGLGMTAVGIFDQVTGAGTAGTFGAGEQGAIAAARLAVFLFSFQIAAIPLTLISARAFRREDASPLAVRSMAGGAGRALLYAGGLVLLATVFTGIVFAIDRHALLNDLLLFRDVLATNMWWGVAVAAVIGAPIAEELLFRGLLYGVLRESPVGASGAAGVAALVWASVHAQYTVYGVATIFLIGLYLAWVREKTGSVLAPMVCHAVYNGAILTVLLAAPTRLLEPG